MSFSDAEESNEKIGAEGTEGQAEMGTERQTEMGTASGQDGSADVGIT